MMKKVLCSDIPTCFQFFLIFFSTSFFVEYDDKVAVFKLAF